MRGRKNPPSLDHPPPCLPACRVCGEPATGFHYGVNTCVACKGFFRRSLLRSYSYECITGTNHCTIGPEVSRRKSCPKCRLQKCYAVGMSKSSIKTGRYSHDKKLKDVLEILQTQPSVDPEKCLQAKQQLANVDEQIIAKTCRDGAHERRTSFTSSETAPGQQSHESTCSVVNGESSCNETGSSNLGIAESFSPTSGAVFNDGFNSEHEEGPNSDTYFTTGNGVVGHMAKESEYSVSHLRPTDLKRLPQFQFSKLYLPSVSYIKVSDRLKHALKRKLLVNKTSPDGQETVESEAKNKTQQEHSRDGLIDESSGFTMVATQYGGEVCPRNTLETLYEQTEEASMSSSVCNDTFGNTEASSQPSRQAESSYDFSFITEAISVLDNQQDTYLPCISKPELSSLRTEPVVRPQSDCIIEGRDNIPPAKIRSDVVTKTHHQLRMDESMDTDICPLDLSPKRPYEQASSSDPFGSGSVEPVSETFSSDEDRSQSLGPVMAYRGHNTFTNLQYPLENNYVPVLYAQPSSAMFKLNCMAPIKQTDPFVMQEMMVSLQELASCELRAFELELLRPLIRETFGRELSFQPALQTPTLPLNQLQVEPSTQTTETSTPLSWCEFSAEELNDVIQQVKVAHERTIGIDMNYWTIEDIQRKQHIYKKVQKVIETLIGKNYFFDHDTYFNIYDTTGIDVDGRKAFCEVVLPLYEGMLYKIIRFCKAIPDFKSLCKEDKETLVKQAYFPIHILGCFKGLNTELNIGIDHFSVAFDVESFLSAYKDIGKLTGIIIEVTRTLQSLDLTLEEIFLLKAIAATTPDRRHIIEYAKVEKVHWKLHCCLIHYLTCHRASPRQTYSRLVSVLQLMRSMQSEKEKYVVKYGDDFKKLVSDANAPLYSEIILEPKGKGDNEETLEHDV